jgi:chromate transporter
MPSHGVRFRDATRVWAGIGLNSFGGPAGQIAVMHRELVERRRWISERRFLHALNYCMILPGPEAQQLATYVGWLMFGVPGGVVAGGLFILPGFLAMLVLAASYATYGAVVWVAGLLFGIQAAVVAIVAEAVMRIGRRTLRSTALRVVAATSFLAIFLFAVAFPFIVAAAAVFGWWCGRGRPAGSRWVITRAQSPTTPGRRCLLTMRASTRSRPGGPGGPERCARSCGWSRCWPSW